jgi:uncharacterized damage-inducible protein DinB
MDLAAKLSEHDYRMNTGYGNGSIHELLFHMLRADQAWRLGIETRKQNPPLNIKDYSDLKALKAEYATERKAWDILLGQMSDIFISNEIIMRNIKGEEYAFICWRILEHIILHGMQHQSEISQLLTAKGYSPGNIDFLLYGNRINIAG